MGALSHLTFLGARMANGMPDNLEWTQRIMTDPRTDVVTCVTELISEYNKLSEADRELRYELLTKIDSVIWPVLSEANKRTEGGTPLTAEESNLDYLRLCLEKELVNTLTPVLHKKWRQG